MAWIDAARSSGKKDHSVHGLPGSSTMTGLKIFSANLLAIFSVAGIGLAVAGIGFTTSGCGIISYSSRSTEPVRSQYHRVVRGDTLAGIGRRYGVSFERIALLNGIRDTSDLEVGRLLLVSYGGPAEGHEADDGSRSSSTQARRTSSESGHMTPASLRSSGNSLRSSGKSRLGWPLGGGNLVSTFGPRGRSFHDGLDLAAPTGTPVYAAHDGIVAYADDELGGYGKMIILKSSTSLMTVYAHNRVLLTREGRQVRRGEKIAEVGSTGHASGPHLHFEARVRDRAGRYVAIDPLPLLDDSPAERPRFRVNESLSPILAKLGWR